MFSASIIVFTITTLALSFVYLYIFVRKEERFVKYWGFCWGAYTASLIFLMVYFNTSKPEMLEFRKYFDMLNILYILFGVYAFNHNKIPSYWHRFAMYLAIWLALGLHYDFSLLSAYIPLTAYQLVISFAICVVIIRKWDVAKSVKIFTSLAFFLWGTDKAIMSMAETQQAVDMAFFMPEIILSNVLNFCIFMIYLKNVGGQMAVAQNLYKIVAENATDAIFYCKLKPKPTFTYITPSVEAICGYPPEYFYNDPRSYLNIVSPAAIDDIKTLIDPQAKNDTLPEENIIVPMIRKDGHNFWGEINSVQIFENGELVAIEGILRDITNLKETELALIASKKSREVLFSYISHELKTPITSIVGYANALSDGTYTSADDRKQALKIIVSRSMTLENLIKDLNTISKLENDQLNFDFMLVSADELTGEIIADLLSDIKAADIRPQVLYRSSREEMSRCQVIADPMRMRQVFSNIIYNAIKYTSSGGTITITLELDNTDDVLKVSIADTGTGIPPSELPHVFDRFFKATQNRPLEQAPGSGLGLTISRELIHKHGGQIWAESRVNRGSVFHFTIPLFNEESQQ